jgi:hypothetical protein
MKLVLSCLLTFMLSISFAFAGTGSELKQAFDELQYGLTVEWDQKDEAFKAQVINNFQSKLEELKANGLDNDQILDFARSTVKNSVLVQDIENAALKLKSQQISQEDFIQIVNRNLQQSQLKGANWTDENNAELFVGVLVVIIALVIIFKVPVHMGSSVTIYN